MTKYRRSMSEGPKHSKWPNEMDQDLQSPVLACRSYGYLLSSYWINDHTVRKALHVRNETVDNWRRCNYGLQLEPNLRSSFSYHVNLSKRGFQSLIYKYTRKYSNDMTFATGGGHTAPEYKPKESLAMFKRWIDNEPL
ncbi:hypothetical protein MKX01_019430 [Papaver californicum]|nr:hypothetical protein MKX01_019430 [Papaver californicum]